MVIPYSVSLWILLSLTGILCEENDTGLPLLESTSITNSHNDSEVVTTELVNVTLTSGDPVSEDEPFASTNSNFNDMCNLNPCQNGGICSAISETDYVCHCMTNFFGKRCHVLNNCTIDEDGEQCRNGACVYDQSVHIAHCECFPGTYWDSGDKQCKKSEVPCFPNPCKNGGSCSIFNEISFNCTCPTGYEGSLCEIKNTCMNDSGIEQCANGLCVLDKETEIKHCQCYDEYFYDDSSKNCHIPIRPCFPNPCKHNGECTVLTDKEYNCTCQKGYAGQSCNIIDHCPADGCNDGECVEDDAIGIQSCHCNEGYFIDKSTKACRQIQPPCSPNPCENDGLCIPVTDGQYNCSCMEGYSGNTCSKRNRCELDGGIAMCKNSDCAMDYEVDTFYCDCGNGGYFDYSESECEDLDLCPIMECDKYEECTNSTCICKLGYKRNKENKKCEPNFCGTYGCPAENMTCAESTDGNPENFICRCFYGFSFNGEKCVSAACIFPALNKCEQECVLTKEQEHECQCFANYTLEDDGHTCESQVDREKCENVTCEQGVCVREHGKETCLCPTGYELIDDNCLDLCTAKKLPDGICPNDMCETVKESGFRCKCSGKFELSADGVTCSIRKMCAFGQPGYIACDTINALCQEDFDQPEGYKCTCPEGTIKDVNGHCSDPCEVTENEVTCSRLGATCQLDINNEVQCNCLNGFTSIKEGAPCDMLAKNSVLVNLPLAVERYRSSFSAVKNSQGVYTETMDYSEIKKDVTKSMTKLFEDFQRANIIKCKMEQNYMLCKVELQFEASGPEISKRIKLSSSCVYNDSLSAKHCLIPPSLVLRHDKIMEKVLVFHTSICDEDIKGDVCGDETSCTILENGKNFACSCENGYTTSFKMFPLEDTRTFIESCKDINECEEGNPCAEFMRCINTIGSFRCECLNGYRLSNNATDTNEDGCVELCASNPCVHGTCTKVYPHKFQCNCDAGYRGELCNFEDKFYKDAKVNTIIVGAVLGGILLVTIILFITSILRFRRKKLFDEPSQILYATEMTERSSITMGTANSAYER